MEILRLPISNPPLSPTQPHVPILVSENCTKATKRLIVLLNNTSAELGIISPRYASALGHGGIAAGSAVNLVKHIRGLRALDSPDQPAILIANLGQLLWHRRAKQAVGRHQWDAMARKVPECPAATIYTEKNTIPGNRTPTDHIRHVLTKVVPEILGPEGKVQIIACFDAGWDLIDVLAENCKQIAPTLNSLDGCPADILQGRS